MISEVTLARIAHSAGVEDPSVVLLDVLSVYLLQALQEAGLFRHMAFKGGNSLRKIFARRGSRFSRDLDFVDASYQQLSDEGFQADHYYLELLEHLDNQVSARDRVDPRELLTRVRNRFGFLDGVTDQERELCLDRRQQRLSTHDAIWESVRARHAGRSN